MILDDSEDSRSDNEVGIVEDSEGWDDIEEDTEELTLLCLACSNTFAKVDALATHCSDEHGLDLAALKKQHGVFCHV